MKGDENRSYCTVDHSNKLGDGRKFDPYQYWLDQSRRRKESEGQAKRDNNGVVVAPRKSRLT